MIVAYAPASGTDLGSKIIADKMSEFLGQPLVSVYKPGGGGSLGAAFVAKSKPDGYTVLIGSVKSSIISPILKKLDYTIEDFALLGSYSKIPLWLAVKTDARWRTLKEFVEEAKKSPGKISVSTYGKLTAVDFLLELFNRQAGIKLVNVPYKSSRRSPICRLGGTRRRGFRWGVIRFSRSWLRQDIGRCRGKKIRRTTECSDIQRIWISCRFRHTVQFLLPQRNAARDSRSILQCTKNG